MSSLAVDKIKKKVTLYMADKVQFSGSIFLSPISEVGVGRQSIFEALTTGGLFMPFETTEGDYSFLSKKQIVWLASLLEPEEGEPPVPRATRNVIIHFQDGKRLRGDVVMEMPEDKSRLSDWLNEVKGFLLLQDQKREVLVNLDFVTRVV